MKVAIDGRILTRNVSGTERYIYSLAREMSNLRDDSFLPLLLTNSNSYPKGLSIGNLNSKLFLTDEMGVDVFHRPYQVGDYYSLLELLVPKCSIVSMLDLISCAYPNYFPTDSDYKKYVDLTEKALNYTDTIISISEHGKKDIINRFGIPSEKIKVTYLGIDTNMFKKIDDNKVKRELRKKLDLPEKFILTLTTDYPHKNLNGLFEAFKRVLENEKTKDFYLVVGGNDYYCRGHSYYEKSLAPIRDRVKFVGYLADEDIPTIYNLANQFVYPSLYEGFGFPVLEAFACEVPLVCSKYTSLPEVAGNAALLVDSKNSNEIAEAIINVATNYNLREDLIEKGKKRIKIFSWKKCASETLKIYKDTFYSMQHFGIAKDDFIRKISSHVIQNHYLSWENKTEPEILPENAKVRLLHKKCIGLIIEFFISLKNVGLMKTCVLVYNYLFNKIK